MWGSRFGFTKKVEKDRSLSEGSVPVIFISMEAKDENILHPRFTSGYNYSPQRSIVLWSRDPID
jgi:hypothetical protein